AGRSKYYFVTRAHIDAGIHAARVARHVNRDFLRRARSITAVTVARAHTAARLNAISNIDVALATNLHVKSAARVGVGAAVGRQIEPAVAIRSELARGAQFQNWRAGIIADGADQFAFRRIWQWRPRIGSLQTVWRDPIAPHGDHSRGADLNFLTAA